MRDYIYSGFRKLSENGVLWFMKKVGCVLYLHCKELHFDLRWGVNTRTSMVDRSNGIMSADSENLPYEGVSPEGFREVMRSIAHLSMPKLFIDIGCGKGRALLLASEYGFKHIVGVELHLDLKQKAELNIKRSRVQENREVTIEVVCRNAKEYAVPDQDAVIFFFNPFNESIMATVLQNVRHSARLKKERYIIYYNAVHKSLLSNPREYTLLVNKEGYSIYRVNI